MPTLWAELANQHDGQDRWYLEALGIGAEFRSDECLAAWLKLVDKDWNTIRGRDIVWRSRSREACEHLAKIIFTSDDPVDQARYFRAMDFHEAEKVSFSLTQTLCQ